MALLTRQRLSGLLRLAVCVAAISWVTHKTDWAQLKQVWVGADKSLLVLSVIAFAPVPVLVAYRLKLLLDVHEIRLSLWQVLKVTLAGNFIVNALPVGTPGGDSVKAYYLARGTPNKHEAVTVVFFDRVIGVLGLVLISGAVVLADWHNPAFARYGRPIGLLLVITVAGGVLYFSNWSRKLLRLDWLLAKMPLSSHLQRIDRAVLEFRQHPRRVLACLMLATLLQISCVAALFLCGWALGMVKPGHPLASFPIYLGYTPICYLTGALPIGVMETTFQQLFAGAAKLGSPEAALSLSLFAVRLTQLIWALPGAPIVLRSRAEWQSAAVPAHDVGQAQA